MGLLKRQEPKCTCLLVAVAAASTCLHASSVYATRAHAKCIYSQSEWNSPFVHSFIKIKAIKVHLKRNIHTSRGVHTFAYHGMGDQVRLGLLEMFTQPIKNGNQKCVEAKRLLHNRSSLDGELLNPHNQGLCSSVSTMARYLQLSDPGRTLQLRVILSLLGLISRHRAYMRNSHMSTVHHAFCAPLSSINVFTISHSTKIVQKP